MGPVKALHPFRAISSVLAFALLSVGAVGAQDYVPSSTDDPPATWQGQAPAHISVVDGVAILERDGQQDDSPGSMPLLAGDRVRTRAGRVEILFADGSTLHLDHHSAIDLQSDELVRILEGRIRLSIPGSTRDVAYRVDGPFGWAQITEPGDYRIALMNGPRGAELELAVLRGRAELINEGGTTPLRAGERAFARANAAPSYAYVVNSAAYDAFDRWSEARRDARLASNAEYLPNEVRPYAASFEQYGAWDNEPTYGRVWYPSVAADWRPYYRGRWVVLRPYGWTWVAHDPWGWPTHHYGRWGFSTRGWFWIPGRTWGAAWVSWAYAPDYVSWCPLGWNNRPVFGININIGRGYDPWRAWTVIPRRHFGSGYVHRYVVHGNRLDHRIRTSFVHRDRAPEIVGRAIPRGASPIRVAGTRDYSASGTPLITNLPADRARTTSDGPRVRMAPQGQRPNGETATGSRAVPRERTVPDRPAVRSERPSLSRSDRAVSPGVSPAERPSAIPGQRAVPRGGDARPSPDMNRTPAYRGDPDVGGRRTSPGVARPSPSMTEQPRGRAVPRGDYGRPSVQEPSRAPVERRAPGYGRPSTPEYRPPAGVDRSAPPVERQRPQGPAIERRAPDRPSTPTGRAVERGSNRPSSGSYERRAPDRSAPPATSGGGGQSSRPSGAPPAGARPRPSGGGRGGQR